MSTNKTLRGGSNSELTKFKAVWLHTFTEEQRDAWRARFYSRDTQEAIRAEIKLKLGINLLYDKQLKAMRVFDEEQQSRDRQAERAEQNERKVREEHPEWTIDQVREEVLRQAYFETLATGDFQLGLATRKSDLAERSAKFTGELEKAKLQLAQEAEERMREQSKLDREKFEFDAATACLKCLPALKAISANKTLSEPQKVDAIRKSLFGVLPQTKSE